MKLIPQLKQEHIEILRSFDSIKEGVSKGEPGDEDLINQLRRLRNILVTHLDLEDRMLYPVLANSKVTEAKELGAKFSMEMLEISKNTFAFFGEYMSVSISNLLKSAEFRTGLDLTIKVVTKRLNIEETVLYPVYEKCCEDKE